VGLDLGRSALPFTLEASAERSGDLVARDRFEVTEIDFAHSSRGLHDLAIFAHGKDVLSTDFEYVWKDAPAAIEVLNDCPITAAGLA
jgi:hypothetical protein